jgi:hypothetical protein
MPSVSRNCEHSIKAAWRSVAPLSGSTRGIGFKGMDESLADALVCDA